MPTTPLCAVEYVSQVPNTCQQRADRWNCRTLAESQKVTSVFLSISLLIPLPFLKARNGTEPAHGKFFASLRSAVMSAVRGQTLAATARSDMLSHALGLGHARTGLTLHRFLAPSVLRLPLVTGRTGQKASQSSEGALRGAFSEEEQLIIERVRNHEVIELDVDRRRISYARTITQGRVLNALTPEELRRALLVVELIDSHGYGPEHIALEQERRVGDSKHRIDLLL